MHHVASKAGAAAEASSRCPRRSRQRQAGLAGFGAEPVWLTFYWARCELVPVMSTDAPRWLPQACKHRERSCSIAGRLAWRARVVFGRVNRTVVSVLCCKRPVAPLLGYPMFSARGPLSLSLDAPTRCRTFGASVLLSHDGHAVLVFVFCVCERRQHAHMLMLLSGDVMAALLCVLMKSVVLVLVVGPSIQSGAEMPCHMLSLLVYALMWARGARVCCLYIAIDIDS